MYTGSKAERSRCPGCRHLSDLNLASQQSADVIFDLSQRRWSVAIAVLFIFFDWWCQLPSWCRCRLAFKRTLNMSVFNAKNKFEFNPLPVATQSGSFLRELFSLTENLISILLFGGVQFPPPARRKCASLQDA